MPIIIVEPLFDVGGRVELFSFPTFQHILSLWKWDRVFFFFLVLFQPCDFLYYLCIWHLIPLSYNVFIIFPWWGLLFFFCKTLCFAVYSHIIVFFPIGCRESPLVEKISNAQLLYLKLAPSFGDLERPKSLTNSMFLLGPLRWLGQPQRCSVFFLILSIDLYF